MSNWRVKVGVAGLAMLALAVVAQTYFPEGSVPRAGDTQLRSLQKINQLLYQQSTNPANISVSNLNMSFSPEVAVTNVPNVTVSNTVPITGGVNANVTNTPNVTVSGSVAVNVTNASLAVTRSNSDANVTNTVAMTGNVGGYTTFSTNWPTGATNAGVVGSVAWHITNEVFRTDGGSGILHCMTLINATNRDYVLWVFPKVVTAPTVGTAFAPSIAELTLASRVATSNSVYGDWNLAGTNYVKTMSNLGIPLKNMDGSKQVHVIATYLDTKSNYTATACFSKISVLQD